MRSQMDFLLDTIGELIEDPNFVSRTEFFAVEEVARWENWLQMELLHSLHRKGAEFGWEDIYFYDRRKKGALSAPDKTTAQIDLTFRPKGADSEIYTAVELKAKLYPDQAIGGVIKDLMRIKSLKRTNFRAVYGVAIYLPQEKSAYEDLVEAIGGEIMEIDNYWRLAVLGWEGRPRADELNKSYAAWCENLVEASKSFPKIRNSSFR